MPGTGLFDLDGKTAVVTGGARGVGVLCAQALLDHGARVVITSRREDKGEESRRALAERGPCELVVGDLSTGAGVAELGDELGRRVDRIDILVNNAGTTWGAPFEDYPAEAWTKVLQLDVAAPFQLVQATLGLLEAGARPGDPARVVNMGSVDGDAIGGFDNYAYPPSKAALHHLTRMLALLLAPRNITVNAIAAGPIQTKMTAVLLGAEPADPRLEPARTARRGRRPGRCVGLPHRTRGCLCHRRRHPSRWRFGDSYVGEPGMIDGFGETDEQRMLRETVRAIAGRYGHRYYLARRARAAMRRSSGRSSDAAASSRPTSPRSTVAPAAASRSWRSYARSSRQRERPRSC